MRTADCIGPWVFRTGIATLALGAAAIAVAGQEAARGSGSADKPVLIIAGGRVISGGAAAASRLRPRAPGGQAGEAAMSRAEVKAVQRELSLAGFDPGPLDGMIGPRVRRALRAFQARYRLEVCGCPDEATLRALGLPRRVLVRARGDGSAPRYVEILAPPRRQRASEAAPTDPIEPEPVPGPRAAPEPYVSYPVLPWVLLAPRAPAAVGRMPTHATPARPLGAGATRLGRTRPPPR